MPFIFALWCVYCLRLVLSAEDQLSSANLIHDPYNYSCTRAERLAGRCRWCHREFPSQDGVWAPFPPYWQFPGKCSNQAFNPKEAEKCLANRTVYAIGNSIARQALFNLIQLLDGEAVSRKEQKAQCSGTPDTHWNCAQEYAGVQFRYLFINYMDGADFSDRGGFPYFRYKKDPSNDTSWVTGRIERPDSTPDHPRYYNNPEELEPLIFDAVSGATSCVGDIETCMRNFFAGSTERDILLFTEGMAYAWNVLRPGATKEGTTTRPQVSYTEEVGQGFCCLIGFAASPYVIAVVGYAICSNSS
jgi:hypothetical protein